MKENDVLPLSSNLGSCGFGAVFLIDNVDTGIPKPGKHPFIIVEGFDSSCPYVVAVLRSSTVQRSHLIPDTHDGERVDGFTKPGWVDPRDWWNIKLDIIERSTFRGYLPTQLVERLRVAVRGGAR